MAQHTVTDNRESSVVVVPEQHAMSHPPTYYHRRLYTVLRLGPW